MGKYGIGIMSGTSLDGLDAVLVDIYGSGYDVEVSVITSLFVEYTPDIRGELLALCEPATSSVDKICQMNVRLGEFIGNTVLELLEKATVSKEDVTFISSHGQTIFHIPPNSNESECKVPSTMQIGDISVISEITGLPVVGDFRTADMAAGGHGAPLVSFFDYVYYRNSKKARAVQNIGGIGNVTYLPVNAKLKEITSFDTGPGNVVMDTIIQRLTEGKLAYDKNGEMAAKGKVHQPLVEKWMNHPYFNQKPPKSTGRELFNQSFIDQMWEMAIAHKVTGDDLVATVTAWTAYTISHAYNTFFIQEGKQIDEVIICGGGSYNPTLLEHLNNYLPDQEILVSDELGIPSDQKEAIAFAIFGYNCLIGQYNTISSATGAKHPVIMGKISCTQPDAYKKLLSFE